ncbi:MAG: ABC transporter ATP-binding protein, partial [Bacilli bacterium]
NQQEILGIVGESGSGKSLSMKAILKILPSLGYISKGQVIYNNQDLTKLSEQELNKIRGHSISMIFQNPMGSLNPLKTIGFHLEEVLINHLNISKKQAYEQSIKLLEMVEINNPTQRLKAYPHQLSGGMIQRVMIALALSTNPDILIADEPTTALDVSIQRQILRLIKKFQKEFQLSTILISHDLAIINSMCDRIIVMYGGEIMEEASKEELFNNPRHPYTKALLNSISDGNKMHKLKPIKGVALSLVQLKEGCPFASRCDYAITICHEKPLEKVTINEHHYIACLNKEAYNE